MHLKHPFDLLFVDLWKPEHVYSKYPFDLLFVDQWKPYHVHYSKHLIDLLFMDMWTSLVVSSTNAKYCMLVVDDNTRFMLKRSSTNLVHQFCCYG